VVSGLVDPVAGRAGLDLGLDFGKVARMDCGLVVVVVVETALVLGTEVGPAASRLDLDRLRG